MKIKTSITLSDYLLKEIDNMVDDYGNRSKVIEAAIKEFITHKNRQIRDLKDLELINSNINFLDQEAKDTLSYQVKMWPEGNYIGFIKDLKPIRKKAEFSVLLADKY